MRNITMKHIAALLLGMSLLLGGCVTTKLPPVNSAEFTGFEDDEKRMWKQVKEGQEKLHKSGWISEDKKLERYLNKVAKKLQPPSVFKTIPFKARILKNPYLNAFAAPNGQIYFHTAMLARMENEAQFATILAHEMTHVTHRHSIKRFRNIKNKSAFFSTLQVAFGGLPGIGDVTTLVGAVGTAAALSGYSKANETEADNVGMDLLVKAGYDPAEAPRNFEFLLQQVKDMDVKEPFFFGSHPKLKNRIRNYSTLLKTKYGGHKGGLKNTKKFLRMTRGVVLDNAMDNLKIGRYEVAKRGVEKYLASWKKDARAYYILGELARQKGEDDSDKEAIKHYKKSISLNPKFPDAHKALGMVYLKKGKKSRAKRSLKKYLSLAKRAPDRDYIKEYIKQCR
jgi:predicted Zn-dependent protease